MCPETHFFHVHNEQDYVLHLSKEVAASLSLLSLFWLVCLTALWLISWSTTVDSSHEGFLGQGLLAAAWLVAGFSSVFLRRDAIAAGFFFVICFLSPQISLFPRGNSFLELYELHAAGQKFDTNESANLEEVLSACCLPALILLSASILPLRLHRYWFVPISPAASFLLRAIGLKRQQDVWCSIFMLAVGLLAACGCTKREWALHRCFELMKGLEASQALLQTKTGEAKKWFGRQRALETLAMQSFDIIFDIDASERQVVVGTSRHVNLFFKQDMEGIPLSSVLPPYERMKLDRSLHEVVQSRSGARAILILPRGEARVCLEYCGDLGQVLVAIELQEKREKSAYTKDLRQSQDILESLLREQVFKQEPDGPGHRFCDSAMDVVLMELGERNPSERNSSKSRRKEAGVGASDEELRPEGSCLDSSKSSEICTWSLSDSARTITFPCPKADKDIQVNMTSEVETKCTQTEFTCDGEGSDFICYHCLMARPPLAPAPRGHSPDRSRSSSRGRRRRRSHISLRSADTATLTAVWSGLMPQHVLMLPEFRKTGPKHVARAIAMLMKQWNLEHPQGVCCRYHAVASLLVFLLTAELKAKCKPAWTPNGSWQCRECGFMHRQVTEECTHCAQYGHWAAECQDVPGPERRPTAISV